VLVSLVGSAPLSTGSGVVGTVGDAVRPITNHLVPQVSQHPLLRYHVSTLEQCLGCALPTFKLEIVYGFIGFEIVI
jgi:hypothetical protein